MVGAVVYDLQLFTFIHIPPVEVVLLVFGVGLFDDLCLLLVPHAQIGAGAFIDAGQEPAVVVFDQGGKLAFVGIEEGLVECVDLADHGDRAIDMVVCDLDHAEAIVFCLRQIHGWFQVGEVAFRHLVGVVHSFGTGSAGDEGLLSLFKGGVPLGVFVSGLDDEGIAGGIVEDICEAVGRAFEGKIEQD